MRHRPCVAIVGAGFSGSLLALHLLRTGPPRLRVLLIERKRGFGPGLAYGAHNPQHLLNVRVGNMSAWPEAPDHLRRWLAEQAGGADAPADAFITRETYGRYLAAMIQDTVAGADGAQRLILVHDEAVGLSRERDGPRLTLAMGRSLTVDAAVLAVGNLPPAPLRGAGLEAAPDGRYASDPWAKAALDGLENASPVLLIGAGLTMVDVALALDARGHAGPILAISRRGLAPRRHGPVSPIPGIPAAAEGPLSRRLRATRQRARIVGWRAAIDELRPFVQAIWRSADLAERRRFLRHLRPWWDVHRHRMAPAVADRIEAMRDSGRLTLAAGRILRVEPRAEGLAVTWRPRGAEVEAVLQVGRIINCTGPGGDLLRTGDPLLRSLVRQGVARADPLGFGVEIDDDGRLIDAQGLADPRLFAVGPITKGSLWEIVAVPDIRNQVASLAARLGPSLSNLA
jgi:uncharacterized NAD(P)/FAD-binding protein YdhS